MTSSISDQVVELNTEVEGLLGKFKALIDNRGAWADGIDGCREGIVLFGHAKTQLQELLDAALQVESELTSARAELDRWSKMHADLSAVERDLRAENDRYRKAHADLSFVEHELRADCEKKRATLEKQAVSLANVRSLAQELVREISS